MRPSLSQRLRVSAVEATTGVLLLGGLFSVLIGSVLGFLTRQDDYQWSDRTNLAALCDVFTGPLLAGMTYLAAVRRRQLRLMSLAGSTPAGRWFPARVVLLASLVWVSAVMVAQAASSLIARPPLGTPFTAWMLLPWLEGATVLAASAAVGAALGARGRSIIGAPILAAVVFSGLYGSLFILGRWSVLSPFDNATVYGSTTEPAPALLLAHTAISAAVSAVALASLSSRGVRRAIAFALAVSLAVTAAITLASTSPERLRYRHFVGQPVCATQSQVELCVWPTSASRLPAQLDVLARTYALASPHWKVPTQYVQEGVPRRLDAAGLPILIRDVAFPDLDAATAVDAMLPLCKVASSSEDPRSNLRNWLLANLGFEPLDPAIAEVTAAPQVEQSAWVRRQLRTGQCAS